MDAAGASPDALKAWLGRIRTHRFPQIQANFDECKGIYTVLQHMIVTHSVSREANNQTVQEYLGTRSVQDKSQQAYQVELAREAAELALHLERMISGFIASFRGVVPPSTAKAAAAPPYRRELVPPKKEPDPSASTTASCAPEISIGGSSSAPSPRTQKRGRSAGVSKSAATKARDNDTKESSTANSPPWKKKRVETSRHSAPTTSEAVPKLQTGKKRLPSERDLPQMAPPESSQVRPPEVPTTSGNRSVISEEVSDIPPWRGLRRSTVSMARSEKLDPPKDPRHILNGVPVQDETVKTTARVSGVPIPSWPQGFSPEEPPVGSPPSAPFKSEPPTAPSVPSSSNIIYLDSDDEESEVTTAVPSGPGGPVPTDVFCPKHGDAKRLTKSGPFDFVCQLCHEQTQIFRSVTTKHGWKLVSMGFEAGDWVAGFVCSKGHNFCVDRGGAEAGVCLKCRVAPKPKSEVSQNRRAGSREQERLLAEARARLMQDRAKAYEAHAAARNAAATAKQVKQPVPMPGNVAPGAATPYSEKDHDGRRTIEYLVTLGKATNPWVLLQLRAPTGRRRLRQQDEAYLTARTRYRQWVKRVHPDKNSHPRAKEAFSILDNAWKQIDRAALI